MSAQPSDMGSPGNGARPKTDASCDPNPNHALSEVPPLPNTAHVVASPPPPPPQVVTDPSSYAVAGKILLAVAGAFAGVLLALVALHLYNTAARRRRLGGGQQRRLLRSMAIVAAGGGGDEDRRDGDGSGAASSPRGLDSAVLAAMPVVLIDAGKGAGDCAVCLAELEHGEKARALPRCGHRFHVECIDAWFRGNATCPLCRADVVVVVVAPDATTAPPSAPAAQQEVRIDVAGGGDAAVAAPPGNGSTVEAAPPVMGRMHSGTDLEKARRGFASTRFSSF